MNKSIESKTKSNSDQHDSESHEYKEPLNKVKPLSDSNKSRKIRELQSKLSRQEEESKKKFDELLSKQSRLEQAIKLLVKQTSSYKKRRQPVQDDVEGKLST